MFSSDRSAQRCVLALLAIATLLRAWLAHVYPVLQAEAYYWTWGRDLAWGFHDHPPAIALLTAVGGVLGVSGSLGLRLGVVALGTLGGWWVFRLYAELLGVRRGATVAVVAILAPFWMPFGVVATPDGPLLVFWAGALGAFWVAWQRGGVWRWIVVGVLTGCACLSKYNGFQLPLVFLVTLLTTSTGRAALRTRGPWMGAVVAALLVTPNLLWNLDGGGSTVSTPFAGGVQLEAAARHLGELALLPLFWLGPVLGVLLLGTVKVVRRPCSDVERLLVVATWVPLGIFASVACVTQVHAHWITTVFVTGLPLALAATSKRLSRRACLGAGVCVLVTAVLLGVPAWVVAPIDEQAGVVPEVPEVLERLALEASGWPQLEARLREELAQRDDDVFLTAFNYHIVAEVEWLLDDETHGLPLRRRHLHQYRLSRDVDEYLGRDALFIDKERGNTTDVRLSRAFERITWLAPVVLTTEDGRTLDRFVIASCEGFLGILGSDASGR